MQTGFEKKVVVSVVMITYNHEGYITKAIEGVLKQKSVSFELIIGNDNSQDGTEEVINAYKKRYPEIVKVLSNPNNIGAANTELNCLRKAKGKYIAYCEGDDFWTDPFKLQKQVDFLESHPDYGMVHGDVNILNQESGVLTEAYNKTNGIHIPSGNIYEFLMRPSHSIKTMTACLRKDILDKYYLSNQEIMRQDWRLIDISVWLMFAFHAKIKYMDEVLATYRLLPESMSRSKHPEKLHAFHKKIFAIRDYFVKNYGCSQQTKQIIEEHKYRGLLSDAYALNDLAMAQKAIQWLRRNNIKLSRKEKVFFMALKFPLLRYFIEQVR